MKTKLRLDGTIEEVNAAFLLLQEAGLRLGAKSRFYRNHRDGDGTGRVYVDLYLN